MIIEDMTESVCEFRAGLNKGRPFCKVKQIAACYLGDHFCHSLLAHKVDTADYMPIMMCFASNKAIMMLLKDKLSHHYNSILHA